jgi:alkanesulfonate monooxygenase SsuD/methylene tetrahydromethanopterin reductase-like flavin-dependent oxidoreductase (luciferase family)
VSGFTLLGDAQEAGRLFRATQDAWTTAGRADKPRLVTGSFVSLGPNAAENLRDFAAAYLQVFSPDFARSLAEAMNLYEPSRLVDLLDKVEAEGADEFIIVPATSDPVMLDRLADVVASRR